MLRYQTLGFAIIEFLHDWYHLSFDMLSFNILIFLLEDSSKFRVPSFQALPRRCRISIYGLGDRPL